MNKHQDHSHIDKVLGGDKEAFRYFIKEYQQMVFSIVLSMVKNKADAEEVTQNTFIRAYKALRSFKREAKFSTWLYKIAVNESLKQLKKRKKYSFTVPLDSDTPEYGSAFNEAVVLLKRADLKTIIDKVMLEMKPKEALILKLHYLHELPIKEVADSTGFSVSNIKVLLHRARKNFLPLYLNKIA